MFFCNEDGEIAAREVVDAPSLQTSRVRLVRALSTLILVPVLLRGGQGELCRFLHPSQVCEHRCDPGWQPWPGCAPELGASAKGTGGFTPGCFIAGQLSSTKSSKILKSRC